MSINSSGPMSPPAGELSDMMQYQQLTTSPPPSYTSRIDNEDIHPNNNNHPSSRTYCKNFIRRTLTCEKHAWFTIGVIIALFISIIAFAMGLVFIPTQPAYTLCNQNIKWGSIFDSIIHKGYPSVNVTLHAALWNPNRFTIELNSLKMRLYYKNTYFGHATIAKNQPYNTTLAFKKPPSYDQPYITPSNTFDNISNYDQQNNNTIQIINDNDNNNNHSLNNMITLDIQNVDKKHPLIIMKPGVITDVFLDTLIEPTLKHAVEMSADYYNNELFVSVQVDFDTSVFAFWTPKINYNASYDFNDIDVTGGGSAENLCKCHDEDTFKKGVNQR